MCYLNQQKNFDILLIVWMNKLNHAYRTIGEVAEILNLKNQKNNKLNTHVLRFWEKEFKQIRPKILNNNRRYYDLKTINLLKKIKFLLKERGMTIKGVKNLLNNKTLDLDDKSNAFINGVDNNIKVKVNKIQNIIKDIKNLK